MMYSRIAATNGWLWTFLSWLLSLAATAGIIALLAKTNNRLLPSLPYGLSLNTYISILSTLVKAGMIGPVAESISQIKWIVFQRRTRMYTLQTFDGASRGVLGSIELLTSGSTSL